MWRVLFVFVGAWDFLDTRCTVPCEEYKGETHYRENNGSVAGGGRHYVIPYMATIGPLGPRGGGDAALGQRTVSDHSAEANSTSA